MTLIHLLVTLIQVGALGIVSRQSLATSQTKNCINLWRISIRRLHLMSCMHPPAILNQLFGENMQGVVILMGMTQRSPFQGGMGSPETTISSSCSSTTRWRMGSSETTSSAPKACSGKFRCGMPNQHFSIGVALWYLQNKQLQWQSYAR